MYITFDQLKKMLKKRRRHPASRNMPPSDGPIDEKIRDNEPKPSEGSTVFN